MTTEPRQKRAFLVYKINDCDILIWQKNMGFEGARKKASSSGFISEDITFILKYHHVITFFL